MTMEVVQERMSVFANIAEVDALTTTLKEQETVEVLEEGRVGLMDRAQNRLTGRGQFTQEADDVESRLRVETRGRLVQEQEKLWLGRQLDTDCYTFALFDGEARFGITVLVNQQMTGFKRAQGLESYS